MKNHEDRKKQNKQLTKWSYVALIQYYRTGKYLEMEVP